MFGEYPAATLILARHGQSRAAQSPQLGRETPLSELGRLQAATLASKLESSGPIVAVYTSPLRRAVETAVPLGERLGLEVLHDPRLIEFEMGTLSIEAIRKRPDLLIWKPEHKAVDGETLGEFSARVASFSDEVVERHVGQRVVVVSHAGTIDAILRWSLGIDPASPWQHEFDIANCSVTELEFWPRGRTPGGAPRYAVLRRIGDVAHLGDLQSDH
jgi:probable phosphoglycerate mutase